MLADPHTAPARAPSSLQSKKRVHSPSPKDPPIPTPTHTPHPTVLLALVASYFVYKYIERKREEAMEKAKQDLRDQKIKNSQREREKWKKDRQKILEARREQTLAAEVLDLTQDFQAEKAENERRLAGAQVGEQREREQLNRDLANLTAELGDSRSGLRAELHKKTFELNRYTHTLKEYHELKADEKAVDDELSAIGAGVEGRKAQAAVVLKEITSDKATVKRFDEQIQTARDELATLDNEVMFQQDGLSSARQSKVNARSVEKSVNEAAKKLPGAKEKYEKFLVKKGKDDKENLAQARKLARDRKALESEYDSSAAVGDKKQMRAVEKQLNAIDAKIGKLNDKKVTGQKEMERLEDDYTGFSGVLQVYNADSAKADYAAAKATFEELEGKSKEAAAIAKVKRNEVVQLGQDRAVWEKKVKANKKKHESLSTQLTDKKAETKKRQQLQGKLEKINVKRGTLERSKGSYEHTNSSLKLAQDTKKQIEEEIQTKLATRERKQAELATLQAKYGVDPTRFNRLLFDLQQRMAELKFVSSRVKTAEQAVSKAAKEQLRQRTVLNTAQIKAEFQLEDVMSTKIAEQIAGKYYIKCNHRAVEDGVGDVAEFTKAYGDDYSPGSSAVLSKGQKCVNGCDDYELRQDVIERRIPMDGDWVVWRPERKAREIRVSVYDEELRKYHVIRLTINMDLGCLIQEESEREEKKKLISKMPREFVGYSLAEALRTRDHLTGKLSNIILYPPQDALSNTRRAPIKLYRRLYVPVKEMAMVTNEVYQDKRVYIALFAFEFFDWMSDWGFYAINTKQDLTLRCSMDDAESTLSAFKYDEYEKAVLFFNVIGTLLVFPVEIAMVVVRLWSSSEKAEELENWVSTGMLISILLEDLPQVCTALIYFWCRSRSLPLVL